MESWVNSKENKRIIIIIIISIFILFAEFGEILYFKKKLYNFSLDKYTEQLDRVSRYAEKSFQITLNHYEEDLISIRKRLKKEENMFSDRIVEQLIELSEFSRFSEIGISDLNGNVYEFKDENYIKAYEEAKEEIKNNRTYISDALKENGDNFIYIIAPLRDNNKKIVGSIWGKVKVSKILSEIKFDKDAKRYFQIIDKSGNYILPSENKHIFYLDEKISNRNLWKELENYKYINKDIPKEIYKNVQEGKNGNFHFENKGEERYVNYRQLGINDWYIFSVQLKDSLKSNIEYIQKLVVEFFVVLIVGIIIILGVIYNAIHIMYKKLKNEYSRVQNINLMFEAILSETRDIPFVVDKENECVFFYDYLNEGKKEQYTFEEMKPENMLVSKRIDRNNLENYIKFYLSVIVEGKVCEPIVFFTKIGLKKRWVRIRFLKKYSSEKRLIGVLEGYDEQMEKDLKIVNQLDSIKKIEEKSQLDFLTKLYNRESFIKKVRAELEKIKNTKELYAFMIIDIDNFKKINDTLGHKIGDNALKDVARILQKSFRKEDIIGRLGGDEFVVFLRNIIDRKVIEERMKIVNERLYKEYEKDGVKINMSGSIGIMIADKYLPIGVLYEKADKALYRVKHSGRNNFMIYED